MFCELVAERCRVSGKASQRGLGNPSATSGLELARVQLTVGATFGM
jgi:hypothetical protein